MRKYSLIFSLLLYFLPLVGARADVGYIEFPHSAVIAELNGVKSLVFFVKNNYAREVNGVKAQGFVHDVEIYNVPQMGGEVERVGVAPEGDVISVFFMVDRGGDKLMYVLTSLDGAARGFKGKIYNANSYSMFVSNGRLVVRGLEGDIQYDALSNCFDGTDLETGEEKNALSTMPRPRKHILRNWMGEVSLVLGRGGKLKLSALWLKIGFMSWQITVEDQTMSMKNA
ncbi:hypothetical protein [Pseudomonas sp. PDM19]|uniref:hypothetical protein n=1 Tax=Pseudomonas sp. PDM19 TaxID=2769272 RepID=UPI0017807481|nr:hypothetical protein [Pseudomonas sp. PDM19]MBD9631645.1 hypothetical protein [Pseudomonas sp. PDM19]